MSNSEKTIKVDINNDNLWKEQIRQAISAWKPDFSSAEVQDASPKKSAGELFQEGNEGTKPEEDTDPMERLPRDGIGLSSKSSHQQYPEYPSTPQFKYYKSYPLYPTISSERYYEWYKDLNKLKNPRAQKRYYRPAGISKSLNNINWDDPKESAKWYSYGYRRPETREKPERHDYNTKDFLFDNARSIMIMPPRKVVPKYVDDRKGTSHLLEPSGLIKKFVFRNDFGKIPEYLMDINQQLGRPRLPDLDKFYRPHRCKFLHGHIHCKICMRAHPIIRHRKIDWHCEMTPVDYEDAMDYRRSRKASRSTPFRGSTGGMDFYETGSGGDQHRSEQNGSGRQNFSGINRFFANGIGANIGFSRVYV